MSKKAITISIILALIFGTISFSWLASFLFRVFMSGGEGMLKQLITGNFQLTDQVRSWPQDIYYYQANYPAYFKKIKMAYIFSGLIHAGIVFLVIKITEKKRSLYGDARFARISEIRKAGLFVPMKDEKNGGLFAGTRIIVGRIGSRYIGLAGQLFAYLAAPTRSGKGVGVVVPVGLSYSDSMVVSDIKKELFKFTAAFRAKCGHEVHQFDPYDPQGRTSRWNPLSYVSRNNAERVEGLNQIAFSLIPDPPNDDNFFQEKARQLFIGLAMYCLDKEKHYQETSAPEFVPTIAEIYDLATDFSGESVPYFAFLMNDEFVATITRQIANSAYSSGTETFASVLSTFTGALSPWMSEPMRNATSGDDFDLRQLRRKKMSIYIGIKEKNLIKAGKIINLFYSQLMNENTTTLPEDDKSLKYQCLMLMDEGTAAGRIAVLEKAVSYMAGYNLRLLFIAQSPSQLEDDKIYGKTGTRNILTNIALKVMYTPNDFQDAEEYSKLLGKTTVNENTSKSRGGGNKGVSRTETQNQRDLMMPQELYEMPKTKEIITFNDLGHPIMADKNKYYEDRVFIKRYLGHGRARVPSLKERLGVVVTETGNVRKAIRSHLSKNIENQLETLRANVIKHFTLRMIELNTSEADDLTDYAAA